MLFTELGEHIANVSGNEIDNDLEVELEPGKYVAKLILKGSWPNEVDYYCFAVYSKGVSDLKQIDDPEF